MPERHFRVSTRTVGALLALTGLALPVAWEWTPALLAQTIQRATEPESATQSAELPSLSVDDATVTEGDTGTRSLVFMLHLSGPSAETVIVDVGTADSTATLANGDYVASSLQLTFAPGSVAESLSVTVKGDTTYEADEALHLLLSNAAGAIMADSVAVGTILDDDLPSVTVADTSMVEGDAGVRPMAFRIRLASPAISPVPFHYATLPGTATAADHDYQPVSGDTLIAVGTDQVVIPVAVFGDSLLEGNERFSLRVQSGSPENPFDRLAVGTLRNDERTSFVKFIPPVPQFVSGTLTPAWGDLDADGRPDLPLYQNDGATFEEMPGIRGLLGNGNYHGAAWCDYDRDGDQDLVVMPYLNNTSSYNFTHLFENTPTGLVEVAPMKGMDVVGFGETPSWGDFNADGWPDLFLPYYSHVAPFRSYLYLNLGEGQFLEAADSAGVSMPFLPPQLRPEGVGVADWNGDGSLDIYCASHLFINDGAAHFVDVRAQVGLPAVFDEGAQFVDFDDDGDLDLYLRTAQGPTLFRNHDGHFSDATASLGIGSVAWGWGDRWADLDSDGDLDLIYFPPSAIVRLQLNNGDGTFSEDSSFAGVLNGSYLSAFADVDADGDLDIAIGDYDRQIARNLLERVPNSGSAYLKVRVEDEAGQRTAFGATVRLTSLDDPKHPVQTRIVDGGSGYLAQDEYTITFGGVGSGRFDLEVSYPGRPGSSSVVGPAQNALLGGIRPGLTGPQLVVVRPSGEVLMQELSPATADVPAASWTGAKLLPAVPNPTRSMTRLGFHLPVSGEVSLTIHDVAGRTVRTLGQGVHGAGENSALWDLRDETGREVPAGLYFVRLERGEQRPSVQRVVVLR